LREVVDTQAVEVPVVMSTIPLVPDAFTPSRNAPERAKLLEKRLEEVLFVVDAFVAKSVVAVAFPRIELVKLARVATRLEMKELEVVALVVEALRAKRLVAVALVNVEDAEKKLEAVTRPLGATEKIEEPVEEATLKIVLADPDVPCTLRVTVEEVAPTPSTTPLSMRVLVPRVLLVAQRVA
jgi:hypothetical protein